jgi:hypothetical protein
MGVLIIKMKQRINLFIYLFILLKQKQENCITNKCNDTINSVAFLGAGMVLDSWRWRETN